MENQKLVIEIVRPAGEKGKFISGKASVRTTRAGGAYMKRSNFEKATTAAGRAAIPAGWQSGGVFAVKIECFFAIEAGCNKREAELKSGGWFVKKPDADNIAKGVLDALVRAGVLADDAPVAELEVRKFYNIQKSEPPAVIITIERLSDCF